MDHLLQSTDKEKRQYLIEELLKSGIYKKNDKHLYQWTLTDLEKEFYNVESKSCSLLRTKDIHSSDY